MPQGQAVGVGKVHRTVTLKSSAQVKNVWVLNELIFIKLTLHCIITFPKIKSFHINIYNIVKIKSYLCDYTNLFVTVFSSQNKSWLWGFCCCWVCLFLLGFFFFWLLMFLVLCGFFWPLASECSSGILNSSNKGDSVSLTMVTDTQTQESVMEFVGLKNLLRHPAWKIFHFFHVSFATFSSSAHDLNIT